MSILKHNLSKRTKRNLILCVFCVVLAIIYLVFDVTQNGPLTQLFTNKDNVINFVQKLGPLGPLAFIFLQILQTVAAPIPGNVTGIVGGFLFSWWGILWTVIGTTIGYWIVFWLSRKFGRNLVEKIIKKETLDKFDSLTKQRGSFVFFLIFLIPGMPDDIIGYVAGLTEIPIRKLLVMATIGRLPTIIASNMIGSGIGENSIMMVAIIVTIAVLALVFVFLKSDQIFAWINRYGDQDDTTLK